MKKKKLKEINTEFLNKITQNSGKLTQKNLLLATPKPLDIQRENH